MNRRSRDPRESGLREEACLGAAIGCGACTLMAWDASPPLLGMAAAIGLVAGAVIGLMLWVASITVPGEPIDPPAADAPWRPSPPPTAGDWSIGAAWGRGKSYRWSKPYCEACSAWQTQCGRGPGNTICRKSFDGGTRMKQRRKFRRPAPSVPAPGEMALPFERDERPDPGRAHELRGPRQIIEQAARDVSRGLRDTGRGIPSDVPGPGVDPEHSPGAEVPPEGVEQGGYTKPRERRER